MAELCPCWQLSPPRPRGKGIKVQFNRENVQTSQDLCLYSVIVFNVGNGSYSLGYCSIDCPSEIRMHFIDHLVPLGFWVPADVNSIYCLSTLSLCPWVVGVFEFMAIVCHEELHTGVFLAELSDRSTEELSLKFHVGAWLSLQSCCLCVVPGCSALGCSVLELRLSLIPKGTTFLFVYLSAQITRASHQEFI